MWKSKKKIKHKKERRKIMGKKHIAGKWKFENLKIGDQILDQKTNKILTTKGKGVVLNGQYALYKKGTILPKIEKQFKAKTTLGGDIIKDISSKDLIRLRENIYLGFKKDKESD